MPIINKSGKIQSHSNGKSFSSMTNVNCQSSNLIYVIACNSCGKQYVGQTKNRLLTRFQGHFNDIAHDGNTMVARHLNRCRKNMKKPEFSITITSFIKSPPESYVSKQSVYVSSDDNYAIWLEPHGLNHWQYLPVQTVRLKSNSLQHSRDSEPPGIMGYSKPMDKVLPLI